MPIITNDLGFTIVLFAAAALAVAVFTLSGVLASVRRRNRHAREWQARALTAERRLQLRDQRDQNEAKHWATTPRDERPTVPINTGRSGSRRRDWSDAS
jgi:type II secretory pathway pseudopilin PulG